MWSRFACWLSRGDNAFSLLLWAVAPPLLTIVGIGFF
jgi:hypothetical protein